MNIIFFIRRFNDIDHIVPIVYRIAKDRSAIPYVFSLNPALDIEHDFRLRFLQDQYQVKVDFVYNAYRDSFCYALGSFLVSSRFVRMRMADWSMCLKKIFIKQCLDSYFKNLFFIFLFPCWLLYNKTLYPFFCRQGLTRIFSGNWGIKILKKYQPKVLVFDRVKKEQYVTQSLVDAAKKLKIPLIAVPHGLNLIVNLLQRDSDVQRNELTDYGEKSGFFDFLIVQFAAYKNLLVQAGIDPQRIKVLGSTRFCREWRKVYHSIAPAYENVLPSSPGKLKVVFMEYPYMYRIHKDVVAETMLSVSKLPFIHLVIKPHTRSNKLYAQEFESGGKITIAYDIPSVTLCTWADVVVGTTSSILLEPLLNNKVLLYPKFFHENIMLFEKMRACWVVQTAQELLQALKELSRDSRQRPYLQTDVDSFITEVVYGGVQKRDVLGEYVDFIRAVAEP